MLDSLAPGDEVAILPAANSVPQQTLEVVKVAFVNVHLVRLVDQRVYSLADGHGLTPASHGFITPATEAHRIAVAKSRACGDDAC